MRRQHCRHRADCPPAGSSSLIQLVDPIRLTVRGAWRIDMKTSRFTTQQMIAILHEHAAGASLAELLR